ncbi:MAG: dTMP kinase [Thermodesulfobacteriota bacterium]
MSLFITFEGIEGCGKTTQMELLKKALEEEGVSVTITREPGGTKTGNRLRPILLGKKGNELFPLTELLLYLACRAQLIEEVIRPALDEGKVVLCDRFADSTRVYQGSGRGLDIEIIDRFNEIAAGGIRPDITFIIDCPVEKGLKRAWARIASAKGDAAQESRFEKAEISFHRKVREGYLALAATEERFKVIDGDRDKFLIHDEIYGIVNSCIEGVT